MLASDAVTWSGPHPDGVCRGSSREARLRSEAGAVAEEKAELAVMSGK